MQDEVPEKKSEENIVSPNVKKSDSVITLTKDIIKDITDKEIFENMKDKLSKKFGEDVVNFIENNYNKGLKYDISVKDNMEDDIRESAYNFHRDVEIAKKQNKIYEAHELSREEGDKIIEEMVKYNPELQEDIKLDPEYFSSPANLNRVLKKHKQEKADKNMANNFGSSTEQYNMEEREKQIIQKGNDVTPADKQEYARILQYKLNQ